MFSFNDYILGPGVLGTQANETKSFPRGSEGRDAYLNRTQKALKIIKIKTDLY